MNTADNIFLSALVIVIFYAYHAGFFRLTKPVVSIVLARTLCPAISIFFQSGKLGKLLRGKVNDLLEPYLESKVGISEYVAGAIIAVITFFVTYILLRILVEYLYSLFKPSFSLAQKLDKILGIILGILTVVIFAYIIYNGCIYLRMAEISCASNIADSIDKSFIVKGVIGVFESILGGVTWW